MNSTLDVKIRFNSGCEIVALDNSDFDQSFIDEIENHAIVEFLQDVSDITKHQRVHVIKDRFDPLVRTSLPIPLPSDGIFTYYRMIIPTFEHFLNKESATYKVKNKYFVKTVYDSEKKTHSSEIYYSKTDLTKFDITKVELIYDYKLVWDAILGNQIYWFNNRFFSICKLNDCLMKQIKENIDKTVKAGCNSECNKKDGEHLQIDFLLESSFALKYLIEQNRLEEAQRILQTLNSCNGLCAEDLETNLSNCNCGKVI